MTLENISQAKVFQGWHKQYTHQSTSLNCTMRFAVFLPPQASQSNLAPVLYWLSGLTCTDENFMQKAGAFRKAAELGIAIVAPDTSPRGGQAADDDGYDLGQGAGFYVNATEAPWADHYRMYDYIVDELPAVIEEHFPVNQIRSITGHSMGGHGALVAGLRNCDRYRSISAFAPISNPINCPWGKKAFSSYLGDDRLQWQSYDACSLLNEKRSELPILVDQGTADSFLEEQLKPEALISAARKHNSPLELRMQPGYDHSYFFISSFIDDHLNFHFRHFSSQKK